MQVVEEGGLEAEFIAPNIFLATETLEARAWAWAERRQQLVLESADPMAAEGLLSAEEAGQRAVQAIREACTAGRSAAKAAALQEAAQRVLTQEFPALGHTPAVLPRARSQGAGGAPASAGPRRLPADPPPAADDERAAATDEQERGGTASVGVAIKRHAAGSVGAELASSLGSLGGVGTSPTAAASSAGEAADYWFFQAADGQSLFLCQLNMRMLLHAYGSFAALPSTITGKVRLSCL